MTQTMSFSDSQQWLARQAALRTEADVVLSMRRKQAMMVAGGADASVPTIDPVPAQNRWETNAAYQKRLRKWRERKQ